MANYAEMAKHYRQRAEEIRKLAQTMETQATRELLERAARDYEKMAANLEGIAQPDKSSDRNN